MEISKIIATTEIQECDRHYQIPFDASRYEPKLLVGWYSPWNDPKYTPGMDLTYGVNFRLPIGTVVRAAKKGRVVGVREGSSEYYEKLDLETGHRMGGKSNFIVMETESDRYLIYSHLMKGSAWVKLHQEVSCGEPLARTGLSGWVPIPNLHFHCAINDVRKGSGSAVHRTIPFQFENYQGSLLDASVIHTK